MQFDISLNMYSLMIDQLESRGLIKTLAIESENKEFYIDRRSFTVLDSMGIKELDEYVSTKEEIYADCLGTSYCSDITRLICKLWEKSQPVAPTTK